MVRQLVKPLHPIEEIASRISRVVGDGVRLRRESGELLTATANWPKADPVASVTRALAEPLDFPPLAAGIVPGDRVAIAVDSTVPCVARVARGALEALRHSGVELHDISIVTTDAGTRQLCQHDLRDFESPPQFVVHDPGDEHNLCLVGTTKRGEPLLINRTLFDADLLLPIGCARLNMNHAYDSLFPRFSNAATIEKYRTPAEQDVVAHNKGRRNRGDEAGWMIGVPMTVQVVPGPNETVAAVLAGEPQAVAKRANQLCHEYWSLRSPRRVSLVVATISGGDETQTWANVGRALAATEEVLDEGGAIAICSNLEVPPSESLGRLIGNPDLDTALRKISHDHGADTWPAWRLGRALQRGPVYFLSQLSEETVEDLGLAPVESVDDIVRLAGRHEHFIVLSDSQHAVVELDGDANER